MRESIIFDITSSHCNANCRWCFVPCMRPEFRSERLMSMEDIDRFVSLNKGTPLRIYFTGFGEPTIHPHYFDIVAIMFKNFHLASMMTNFSLPLSDRNINLLLFVFERVVIEMGGLSPETRDLNMRIPGDAFFDNLKTLDAILSRNFSLKGSVTVKILHNSINHNELATQDPSYLFPIILSKTIIYSDPYYRMMAVSKTRADYLLANSAPGVPLAIVDETLKIGCTSKRLLRITPSGEVYMCCTAPNGYPLGNAFQTPLKDLVASPRYEENLKRMDNRTYSPFCKVCHE